MPSIWPFTGSTHPLPTTSSSHDSPPAPPIPPLIIVEGFLSAAQSVVWGNEFRLYLGVGHQQLVARLSPDDRSTTSRRSSWGSSRAVVFAPIGPVSSLHDRACELFYALRGGTVDYGAAHARQHGHARFGRHYPHPLCPSWGRTPAHFLGHSLGGPTILKLQQLLRQGFFDHALPPGLAEGKRAEDLILSITSVSSPFRGTPLVYSLGSEPLPYPKVRMFSFGDLLSKLVHVAAFVDLPGFDAHADAWHFSARRRRRSLAGNTTATAPGDAEQGGGAHKQAVEKQGQAGLVELLRQLWRSDWAGGRDCAPWECTFAQREMDRAEDGWGVSPTPGGRTWYRSYSGAMTVPDKHGHHRPESFWSLSPLTYTSWLIGRFDYSRLDPTPSFLAGDEKGGNKVDEAWRMNDGVVPLASQWHPFECSDETCRHFKGMPASLPARKRRRRMESTDSNARPPMSSRSSTSEAETLVEVHTPTEKREASLLPLPVSDDHSTRNDNLLPLPATSKLSDRSMLSTARSAAKIAYLTSLRAFHPHQPLATPSDEELSSFLPPTPTPEAGEEEEELWNPRDNKWYTFELANLDHTSLCPFWTGSEVQKQFWTGIGLFLASVDRKVGYEVEMRPEEATGT